MARILIVEDSDTYRLQLQKLVEKLGHECLVASDTTQGVTLAVEEVPDLILMDIVMPAGQPDGYQAMRQILREPTTAHIPVVLVTSKGQKVDRIYGERQGASGYITKPIDEKALTATIAQQSQTVATLHASLQASLRPTERK